MTGWDDRDDIGGVSGSQGAENVNVGECVCQIACDGQVH